MNTVFKIIPLLTALFAFSCNDPMPKVKLYAPPGDLSGIDGLSKSPYFNVLVEDSTAFVYYGKDDSTAAAYNGKGVSFLNFEMSYGPVSLDIITHESIDSFQVLKSPGKVEQQGQSQLHITVNEPVKFLVSVFLEEVGQQDFFISAEMPDWKKPKESAKGVLYLKPGTHQFGEAWNPFVDGIHTLYLEGGAVVEATINVPAAKEVNILGRGIFAQAFAKNAERKVGDQKSWFASGMGISLTNVEKVKVDGIAIINSPACQLAINNANEVIMKNVKLCGFGEENNDGLHLYSRNVIAEDLFICSSNDRITLNGAYDNQKKLQSNEPLQNRLISTIAENIQIRNAVFYGIKNGGDIIISRNANADVRSVFVESVTSLKETKDGFVSAQQAGEGNVFDVIVVDSKIHHNHLVDIQILDPVKSGIKGAKIRSIYLDDIVVESTKNKIGSRLAGASTNRLVEDVIFTNITTPEGMVNDFADMNISTNGFVKDVQVQVIERDD